MSILATELIIAGTFGVLAVLFYMAAVFAPLSDQLAFAVALLFPLCGVVATHGQYRALTMENDSATARLGLMFAVGAFVLLAAMLAVQLVVQVGIAEYKSAATDIDKNVWSALHRSVRLVDLGLDLAWDFFIGSSFIAYGLAMRGHSWFGWRWGAPSVAIGAALMVLNAASFPWPPGESGSIDIGPFAGLFMAAVSVRLIVGARRLRN